MRSESFSAGDSRSEVWTLLRRAMMHLNNDQAEASRCLRDAHRLLGAESETASLDRAVPKARIEPGCLAAWQVRRALEFIEQNLTHSFETDEIAAAIGLSKSHFSRAFKSTVGSSPMAYVAARRVERAKHMMLASAERLADVALECGFSDQSHLNRQFRRAVGLTPGQWRRSSIAGPGRLDSAINPARVS